MNADENAVGGVSDDTALLRIQEARDAMASLPELTFPVVKFNVLGRGQKRLLRLKADGIYNLKVTRKGEEVHKVHSYLDAYRIMLRDIDHFELFYRHYRTTKYRSPVAQQIVQEISARMAILQTTAKKLQCLADPNVGLRIQSRINL